MSPQDLLKKSHDRPLSIISFREYKWSRSIKDLCSVLGAWAKLEKLSDAHCHPPHGASLANNAGISSPGWHHRKVLPSLGILGTPEDVPLFQLLGPWKSYEHTYINKSSVFTWIEKQLTRCQLRPHPHLGLLPLGLRPTRYPGHSPIPSPDPIPLAELDTASGWPPLNDAPVEDT